MWQRQQDQNDAKHISVYGSMLLLPCAEHCNTVGNKQYQQKDHTGYTVVKDRKHCICPDIILFIMAAGKERDRFFTKSLSERWVHKGKIGFVIVAIVDKFVDRINAFSARMVDIARIQTVRIGECLPSVFQEFIRIIMMSRREACIKRFKVLFGRTSSMFQY